MKAIVEIGGKQLKVEKGQTFIVNRLEKEAGKKMSFDNVLLVEEKGKTIIPLNLYYKEGRVKIKFAIAKGRKLWDKRNYKKEQDIDREIKKSMKGKF